MYFFSNKGDVCLRNELRLSKFCDNMSEEKKQLISFCLLQQKSLEEFEFSIEEIDKDTVYLRSTNPEKLSGLCRLQEKNGYSISLETSIFFDDKQKRIYCKEAFFATKAFYDLLLYYFRSKIVHDRMLCPHCSAIAISGNAILFCGQSGVGKSTQADLWKKYTNAVVINYDKPVVYSNGDNQFYVTGTPWSGKEVCYKTMSAKIRAAVFVEQSSENHLERISGAELYSIVYPNFFTYPLDDEHPIIYEEILCELIKNVDFYRLYCTPTEQAVEELFKHLFFKEQITYKDEKTRRESMKIKDDYILRNIADEWIVIARGAEAIKAGSTLILNETGVFIWNSIKSNLSKEQIVSEMAEEYDVNQAQALVDVNSFIEKLKGLNILC